MAPASRAPADACLWQGTASYNDCSLLLYILVCAHPASHIASMTASLCLASLPHCGVCCSDALEEHVAAVVSAEVARTLGKCGLAEVVDRLRELQASDACVRFTGAVCLQKPAAAAAPCRITHNSVCCMLASHTCCVAGVSTSTCGLRLCCCCNPCDVTTVGPASCRMLLLLPPHITGRWAAGCGGPCSGAVSSWWRHENLFRPSVRPLHATRAAQAAGELVFDHHQECLHQFGLQRSPCSVNATARDGQSLLLLACSRRWQRQQAATASLEGLCTGEKSAMPCLAMPCRCRG